MADFATELWTSIFTPGATPTLVVATNASFAALQVLLLMLLAATRSIHFGILSVLCGGLWWSINWFVREIQAMKEEEAKQKRQGEKKGAGPLGTSARDEASVTAPADSEDTETEELGRSSSGLRQRTANQSTVAGNGTGTGTTAVTRNDGAELSASSSVLSVQSLDSRKHASTGNVSGTDSEWDKLDSEVE